VLLLGAEVMMWIEAELNQRKCIVLAGGVSIGFYPITKRDNIVFCCMTADRAGIVNMGCCALVFERT